MYRRCRNKRWSCVFDRVSNLVVQKENQTENYPFHDLYKKGNTFVFTHDNKEENIQSWVIVKKRGHSNPKVAVMQPLKCREPLLMPGKYVTPRKGCLDPGSGLGTFGVCSVCIMPF